MGKLNKREASEANPISKRARFVSDLDLNNCDVDDLLGGFVDNGQSSLNWQELVESFKNKNIEEIIENLTQKLNECENVDFDQICLILKHFLFSEPRHEQFLSHFLNFNNGHYLNLLVERFNRSNEQPNAQWMISEIFKIMTSICTSQEADKILACQALRGLLFQTIFNESILAKIKSDVGLSVLESAILVNVLDCSSNLCEIKSDLANSIEPACIDWLASALVSPKNSAELNNSIAKMFFMLSEHSFNANSLNSKRMIELFFGQDSFLKLSIDQLSKAHHHHHHHHHLPSQSASDKLTSSNLSAKLYLITAYANMLLSDENLLSPILDRKVNFLLELVNDYGSLLEHSLNIKLDERDLCSYLNREDAAGKPRAEPNDTASAVDKTLAELDDNDHAKTKQMIKFTEQSIECKLLAIDLMRSLCSFFKTDDDSEEEDGEWEEIDSDDEDAKQEDVEMDHNAVDSVEPAKIDSNELSKFKSLLTQKYKLMPALLNTICYDNENVFQDAERDRIEHFYTSIKLIRNEALQTFNQTLSVLKNDESLRASIDAEWLHVVLTMLATKSPDDLSLKSAENNNNNNNNNNNSDLNQNDVLVRLCELAHDIFTCLLDKYATSPSIDMHLKLIELIKSVLLKYRTNSIDLCIRMGRILTLLAIRARDSGNLALMAPVVQQCATILIEMTSATFELMDQSQVETFKLNAELIDFVIDLFSEDSLGELEKELNLLARMKVFSDKFYAKCKKFKVKNVLSKGDSVLIKTVKDNLKPFIEYKSKK